MTYRVEWCRYPLEIKCLVPTDNILSSTTLKYSLVSDLAQNVNSQNNMSAAVLTLVIFSACAFGSISCQNDNLLQTLLSTLEKLVNFYQNSYKGMNLDGIFGLRTLEGGSVS